MNLVWNEEKNVLSRSSQTPSKGQGEDQRVKKKKEKLRFFCKRKPSQTTQGDLCKDKWLREEFRKVNK